MLQTILSYIYQWLSREKKPAYRPIADFNRVRFEIRPGDVLLFEGRSRVSEVIKQITQSSWSHSVLYIGRLHDIENLEAREYLKKYYSGGPDVQLIIEGLLGSGLIVTPLSTYQKDNIRVCRPSGIIREDAQKVINYTISRLGSNYNVRQLLELGRFLFPWSIIPRRWRSTLFEYRVGPNTQAICSGVLAEAFSAIHFPILPLIKENKDGHLEYYHRNPKLVTPRDFDYSPYFRIIKYPYRGQTDKAIYKNLPWNKQDIVSNSEDNNDLLHPQDPETTSQLEDTALKKSGPEQAKQIS